ncbi:MAG TPA: ParB/RepB/Spo0J family partition protein [Candidatus Acidoferrales bacterium]|nr:ParB/RepB/Spo0J family partition protein [Candidatus Acidoferrales bacterium]
MNAATAVSTTNAAPPVEVSVREIPLSKISESKTNPRRQFDETKLAELADNIRQYGVLQAILVRPIGEAGSFEVVAGTRRYRASKLAERDTIPATVRELTDAQCLELQLIENLQRSDVHELDEAQGYAVLMQLQPENYTVETIATKVGRSEAYVYARLRLLHLIPEARQAFYEAKLTVAHAFEMARLQPNDQQRALQECFPQHRSAAAILKDRKAEAVTVRELRQWIEREIHLDLTNTPFDPQDENLLPSAGACARCPKRTGSNPLLFPEVRQKSICTDRECYRAKVEAFVQFRVKPLEEKGEKPLRVSQAPSWQTNGHARNVLVEGQFLRAKSKSECPNTKPAVLIDGKGAGTIFHICRDEKCPVHSRITRYEPTPQERAQRAKERLAEGVEKQSRFRILDAVRKKLPDALPRAEVEMIALDYFRRLGHDNHRRLCRVYGWEEKKTKTSWGGQTVDYEKIAMAAVEGMTTADLHRFLFVAALASDLYCPGYNPAQALAKDSNLARAATRYKVDSAKITAAVRTELTKAKAKSPNPKTEKKAANKLKRKSQTPSRNAQG